ncbi:efflux RND transporter periplasmic adaptor subunit [Seonamhaeicola sp.]|uniref:efflux RND transporter periplasmic adaptor subunit n=1 Tax=Seonamhaeicola sp. TaxID=1912245 RepID=UPI002613D952|nr:efflux RND transporter periplasmic adaptor subunit [Seonamhaeicola sp.]
MKQLKTISIVLMSLILASCSEKKEETKKSIRPVKYHEVGYLDAEKIRTFSGTAQTERVINLSFRSSGVITDFNIKLGQEVKKGDLLAKLDNVQARLNYQSAVSSMNSAESQMNTAKLSLGRVRSLFEKGSASLSDFESAKNAYKTAKESFESSKRSAAIQQEQVRYGYLYAPEDGIIAAVYSEIDENVSPGQNIATLNAGTDIEILLGIPESAINGVKVGMDVKVDFTSIANATFNGKVTEVAPAVDANIATYPVRITVSDPSDDVKSGMAANVSFDFGSEIVNTEKRLVVPAHAVGEDSKGHFVFLIEGSGDIAKVKKQRVTIGSLTTNGFEITSGLTAGQKIATAGLQTLLDGQEVKL